MGSDLYNYSGAAQRIMNLAGDEIKAWCFEGTKDILQQTNVTQPCVYAVTMAAYEAFLEALGMMEQSLQDAVEFVGAAGFSMGEYAALTAAGAIDDIQKGMEIIIQRGTLMNAAGMDESGNPKGGMVAAFGERSAILDCVEAAKGDGILAAVNFNSPVQTVIAGDKDALERFKVKAGEVRIKAKSLSVSTAFHSPMMEPAAKALLDVLTAAELKAPKMVIYSNVTGRDMMEELSDGIKTQQYIVERMASQAKSPVYWQETIENMQADGITAVVEIGPGTTLSGLTKKIAPEILTMNIEDMASLEKTIKTIAEQVQTELGKTELPEETEEN